jgi:hypothetical protein
MSVQANLIEKDRWYWLKLTLGAVGWFFYPVLIIAFTGESGAKRMPWKEFKSGIRKHKCDFDSKVEYIKGYGFRKCKHFGCNTYDPID